MRRGPIDEFLSHDHARLDALLQRTVAGPAIDLEAYREFRAGLLRHMAMEEKVLMPEARRLRGGEPLPVAAVLRADHAALAALLVPTPTHELMARVREVLVEHNPLEEDDGGLYPLCEQLAGSEADELLARLQALPEVRMTPNADGPKVMGHIEALMQARRTQRGS